MAQHKAATSVTIAPISEKSGFALLVEKYWKLAALLAVIGTAGILWAESRKEAEREVQVHGWESLLAVCTPDPYGGLAGAPAELRTVADRIKDTDAGAWGLYLAAKSALERHEFELAKQAVDQLEAHYPGHPLVKEPLPYATGGTPVSPARALAQRIDEQKGWQDAHPTLFANPAPPADGPRVRLTTDQGVVIVQLYSDVAPKHAENFLKLVREGFYNGTKIHRVRKGNWIQGGDPNSKEADTAKWGEGGPGYGLDREENDLKHFSGYLSMWKKPGEAQSSGSQFVITTGDVHSLDGQQVVFGKVIEGLDVVEKVGASPVAAGTERPEDPATLQSAEVL